MICIAHFSQSLHSVNGTAIFLKKRYRVVREVKQKNCIRKVDFGQIPTQKDNKAHVSSVSPSSETSLGSSNGLFSYREIYLLVLPSIFQSRKIKEEIFSPCSWTPQLDGVTGLSS